MASSLVACEPDRVRERPVLRFIEEPAPPIFEVAELLGEETTRTWSFSQAPPGAWQAREVDSVRADGVSWWLAPKGQRAVLDLDDVALAAEEVDVVAVVVEGRSLGGANLHWGPTGEAIVPERQLHLPFAGSTRQVFLFRVAEHPEWRGEVGRLVLTLWAAPGTQVGISSIKAFRESIGEQEFAAALRSPWRVELMEESGGDEDEPWGDRRLALIGWPGHDHSRELEVPAGAMLELGFGVWQKLATRKDGPGPLEEPSPALRFRVSAEAGGEMVELANEPWDGEPGWRSLRLDLEPWADSQVRFTLSVQPDVAGQLDPRRIMPFWAHPEVVAPVESAEGSELAPNIVLVVADTLRADRLSLYGHGRQTTPNLDAWASEHGAVFESVVSSAGWTLPAHASMFTGLDAPRHGVNWPSSRVDDTLITLAERLYRRGYTTEAITGGGYLDPAYGLDRGFMRYRSWPRHLKNHGAEPPRTVAAALESLERLGERPHFLFVHTYAAHWPYAPWQPHFSRFAPTDPGEELVMKPPKAGDFTARHELYVKRGEDLESATPEQAEDQYDSGIARLDLLLAPLFEALGRQRETLVIFTSDHGEMLGERGLWDHGHIFDPTLKVPLVIATPDRLGAGSRIGGQARTVDLMPTLLELLDHPIPPGLDGRSLAPRLRGEQVAVADAEAVAWSYGRRVDDGLSLRIRDRQKLLIHDDLLTTSEHRVRAFALGPAPREETEIEVPATLEPLVERARRRLLLELPGLHLRFSNMSSSEPVEEPRGESLKIEVSSGAAVPERIKAPDLTCECVEWIPPVGLRVEVPPGESFTLVLGDVQDARLRMILERHDGTRQRLTLDLTEHDRPLAMAIVDESFQVSAGPPPDIGVGVRFHESGLIDPGALGLDRETLESLRALGYIE